MSVEQIQTLADGLATRLGRAVLVDDRDLRLIAASEDFGDADPARVWSLLHRRTRPEDVRHEDIARLDTIPGHPRIGLFVGAGHAAKFAGLIGHILADLAIDGRTDHPIAAFSIDRPAVRDPGFPSDFRFSRAAHAPGRLIPRHVDKPRAAVRERP